MWEGNCMSMWLLNSRGPLGVISESGYQRHCRTFAGAARHGVGVDHLTALKVWSTLVVLPAQLPFGIIWGPCFYCRLPLILQLLPAAVITTVLWHLAPSCSPYVCDPPPCSEPQGRRPGFIHGWCTSGNSLMIQDKSWTHSNFIIRLISLDADLSDTMESFWWGN